MENVSPSRDQSMSAEKPPSKPLKYIDIGINLTDPMYRGIYHGRQAHPEDLPQVISRAQKHGVRKMMVTGSDIEESQKAIELVKQYPNLLTATAGIHPCASSSPSVTTTSLPTLTDLLTSPTTRPHLSALGELGLDYDRLHLSPATSQLSAFNAQLNLLTSLPPEQHLPLFLHSRAAHADFVATLTPHLPRLPRRGLVHSFTGTAREMRELVGLGFDIGLNGCSVKAEENLAVVAEVPLDRLQVETDGPWCEIRPSHASARLLTQGGAAAAAAVPRAVKKERWDASGEAMVKGRNEPCTVGLVVHVIARVKGLSVEEVAAAAWRNSVRMFGLGEHLEEDEQKDGE